MAAEKNFEFKIWYRPQFLSNVCHICKQVRGDEGVICPGCSLVSYCGQEHYEDDIDDHEEICDALKGAASVLGTQQAHDKAYLLGPEQWREFRLGLVGMCSKHLERPLIPWELEICLFPPLCATCHKFSPNMEKCTTCSCVNWCTLQHKPKDHSEHCINLNLFKQILQRKVPVVKSSPLTLKPSDMNSLYPEPNRDEVVFSLLTEIATSPLSILHYLPESDTSIIHIVGPEPHFEANNLTKWDVFLFNLRQSTKKMTLNFVGPEIGPLPPRKLKKNGRTLKFIFHQLLYHDFVNNGEQEPPTMICALNPGLYRSQGFNSQDSWAETINAMFKHPNIPVLVTAYTQKEVKLDHDRIKTQIPHAKTIVKPSRNPFSSKRPLMNFVSDECTPIVFKNAFHTVLTT